MATSAWAETKHLKCDIEVVDKEVVERILIEIAFDLELKRFEINMKQYKGDIEGDVIDVDQGNLTVFPTFLSFSFILEDAFFKLEVNREDLMSTLYEPNEDKYEPRIYPSMAFKSFKCQLVRGKKNLI